MRYIAILIIVNCLLIAEDNRIVITLDAIGISPSVSQHRVARFISRDGKKMFVERIEGTDRNSTNIRSLILSAVKHGDPLLDNSNMNEIRWYKQLRYSIVFDIPTENKNGDVSDWVLVDVLPVDIK